MSDLSNPSQESDASRAVSRPARSPGSADTRWEREFGAVRARRLSFGAFAFAIGFALYLGLDRWLIGDVFGLSMILRLLVVVPFALAVGVAIRRGCSPVWRESLSAAVMVVGVATTAALFLASSSPTAVHYQYLIGLPILFGNIVQRPDFEAAAIASVLSLAIYIGALAVADLPLPVAVAGAVYVTVTVGFSLIAGRNVERELRRAFLRRVRSEKAANHLAHRNGQLLELSNVDTLTGLANRRRLDERLAEMAAWSRDCDAPVALLMIDVDHFKLFNDRYGHPEGDRCLMQVAAVAREQVRRHDDVIGRLGGEEFLAILPGMDMAGAIRVAERIRVAVEAMGVEHDGCRPAGVVSISIGCASGIVGEDWSLEDLLRLADDALYTAKRRGRNLVHPEPIILSAGGGRDRRLRVRREGGRGRRGGLNGGPDDLASTGGRSVLVVELVFVVGEIDEGEGDERQRFDAEGLVLLGEPHAVGLGADDLRDGQRRAARLQHDDVAGGEAGSGGLSLGHGSLLSRINPSQCPSLLSRFPPRGMREAGRRASFPVVTATSPPAASRRGSRLRCRRS